MTVACCRHTASLQFVVSDYVKDTLVFTGYKWMTLRINLY